MFIDFLIICLVLLIEHSVCRTSKSIDSTYALNSFWYLNMSSCLLVGQVPICCFRTFRWALVFAQWNGRWSMVWYSWPQLHVASSLRWNRCRYTFVIPCPVSTAVIFGVSFIYYIYHIISYYISYHIISYHIMSCHVMSCHVMSCHVMSCHVMSYQTQGVSSPLCISKLH